MLKAGYGLNENVCFKKIQKLIMTAVRQATQ